MRRYKSLSKHLSNNLEALEIVPLFRYTREREAFMYLDLLQTMHLSFQEICQGERPWTALGNFMNDWYEYHKDLRTELVAEPLLLPDPCSTELFQWATFCAASVEWFCSTYHVPCPSWVDDPVYYLSDPWFTRQGEKIRPWLLENTPQEFSKRNIFCGNRMFLNKYEAITKLKPHQPTTL